MIGTLTKRPFHTVANSVPILDRLVGLETEYAIRFHRSGADASVGSRFLLYQSLVSRLQPRMLTAPARHFKEGLFLANGGAVWFESERPAAGGGLIEGSTPECRGPRQVLLYQRAQDRMLGEAARTSDVDGRMTLIKNDRDGCDHVYGAQENYEAVVASGALLGAWRVGLILLVPLLLMTWLGFLLMIGCVLVYLAIAGLVFLPMQAVLRHPHRVALVLFGRDLVEGRETGGATPVWLESLLLLATRVVTAPLAVALWCMAALFAFRRIRHRLAPFLISRCVVAGAGMVDSDGRFGISDKGPAVNCVLGLGGFLKDRPIFTIGHFFKALCVESWASPRSFFRMFGQRQRLQIGIGDSNMAETAEFLRVGTTALVLDLIEADELPALPTLKNPIRALHAICSDPTLKQTVTLADGRQWTALDLQRFYWDACRQFVARHPEANREAHEVLQRWSDVLDSLEQVPGSSDVPLELIGLVDWATKLHLIKEAVDPNDWSTVKKVDICYHELSDNGYFSMLQSAGLTPCLIESNELDLAVRVPPPDSPATMRGHFIREFSGDADQQLSVNWQQVVLGRGFSAKVIPLAQYDRRNRCESMSCDPAETE